MVPVGDYNAAGLGCYNQAESLTRPSVFGVVSVGFCPIALTIRVSRPQS